MPTDSNGMEFIYASLVGGFSYTMNNNDPLSNNHFQLGGSVSSIKSMGNGFWGVNDPSQVRLNIKKFPEFEDSDGGCNMDFTEIANRGYAYKKGDFRDIEVKMIVDVKSLDPHVLIGGPTGHHPSNSNPCCQGYSYFSRFQNTATFQVQIGKEMFHNNGYESLDPTQNSGVYSTRLQNAVIGIGYCRYNGQKPDGTPTVTVEAWIDTNADGKDWKLFQREVDFKGRGWFKKGAGGDICGGDVDQVGTWGNGRIRIRWDDPNADVRIKSLTLREIAPFAPVTTPGGGDEGGGGSSGGTDVPESPTFGFVPITFRRDFNFYTVNTCAAAGEKEVYRQLVSNGVDGSDLDHDGYHAGETCKNTASKLYGAQISSGTIYATKHGAGTNLDILILDSGNNVKSTLATITAASIGTSETALPFTSSSNSYVMTVNDRFAVREAGSPNGTDYISVARDSSSSYDGSNSVRYTYYGSYSEKSGDLKAIINVFG